MTDLYKCFPSSTLPLDEEYEDLFNTFNATGLTSADLFTLEPVHIAKICDRSAVEVRKFLNVLEADVRGSLVLENGRDMLKEDNALSHVTTGDMELDHVLGGHGLPVCSITEVSGPSAAGKSHLLLQLAATVQLPTSLGGLNKSAIYISTESGGLETRRLQDIIESINKRFDGANVSSNNVRCFNCYDTEELLHVMQYQLPIAIEKHNVGVILIDSIAAHYRAEASSVKNKGDALSRSQSLTLVARLLRTMAHKHKLSVLVANQVADRFSQTLSGGQQLDPFMFDHQLRWYSGWTNETIIYNQQLPVSHDKQQQRPTALRAFSIFESFDEKTDGNSFILAKDALELENPTHSDNDGGSTDNEQKPNELTASQYAQQRVGHMERATSQSMSQASASSVSTFSEDESPPNPNDFGKVPALGLVWANEIDQRIVLKRSYRPGKEPSEINCTRTLEIVFSPWCAPHKIGFKIVRAGIQTV